jgi:hypothetical protein
MHDWPGSGHKDMYLTWLMLQEMSHDCSDVFTEGSLHPAKLKFW